MNRALFFQLELAQTLRMIKLTFDATQTRKPYFSVAA
jgi:hypothetical protein